MQIQLKLCPEAALNINILFNYIIDLPKIQVYIYQQQNQKMIKSFST